MARVLLLALLTVAGVFARLSDIAWVDQPQSWHQQAIRIVDHPFTSLSELRSFGLAAKRAGVSVVELVGPQKDSRCVGYWCGGLGLCDHINGSFPAKDGTLAEWRQMLEDIKPVRLMWWANFAYWSTQGEVWEQAMANPWGDVGRFFSYARNASAMPVCPGRWLGNPSDPKSDSWGWRNTCFQDPHGEQLCAQGSFGSVSGNCSHNQSNHSLCFDDSLNGCSKAQMEQSYGGKCIQSVNANIGHKEYQDYLADALARSWSGGLGIDGYIVDTSFQVPCSPGINPHYGEPGGSEYIFYNEVIGKVRETQPQVVLSGEDCSGWDDAIEHNFQLPGTKSSEAYQAAMQGAVAAQNLDTIEDVVASSGADAATVICYLHPGLDGKQPGACPTLYYRDTGATYTNVTTYRLWMALEAASGVLSEHQHSPTAVFGTKYGSWNCTIDPAADDGQESPLWAFAKNRALNRLSLRTKLKIQTAATPAHTPADPLSGYDMFPHANCYNEGHGGIVLPGTAMNQTAESCAALCTANSKCDCVTFQARAGESSQHKNWNTCWQRANCQPYLFERDVHTQCYDVYVKKKPKHAGGALAYLKHDALGPHGDAAVVVFNPGQAQTLTVDLSSLPPALLASGLVPRELFSNTTAGAPLASNWSVRMEAASFAAFGFRLGVFAPLPGKFEHCSPDDGYVQQSPSSTLQACFLDCKRDTRCQNVFVTIKALPRWLEKPSPVACTLLGHIDSTGVACPKPGAGTLVAALAGSRPVIHRGINPSTED